LREEGISNTSVALHPEDQCSSVVLKAIVLERCGLCGYSVLIALGCGSAAMFTRQVPVWLHDEQAWVGRTDRCGRSIRRSNKDSSCLAKKIMELMGSLGICHRALRGNGSAQRHRSE
jgi:hypothetical protein